MAGRTTFRLYTVGLRKSVITCLDGSGFYVRAAGRMAVVKYGSKLGDYKRDSKWGSEICSK